MGVFLIVRCNSLPWQPDCFVFQPSLDETSSDEFTVHQTINETRISATHRLSFTRSLLYSSPPGEAAIWLAAAPRSHIATRWPQRTGGRIDMLPRSAVWNAVSGRFGGAPSTSTGRSRLSSQGWHRTVIHCYLFFSLNEDFSLCFLLGWKLCAPRPVRGPQTSKTSSAAFC